MKVSFLAIALTLSLTALACATDDATDKSSGQGGSSSDKSDGTSAATGGKTSGNGSGGGGSPMGGASSGGASGGSSSGGSSSGGSGGTGGSESSTCSETEQNDFEKDWALGECQTYGDPDLDCATVCPEQAPCYDTCQESFQSCQIGCGFGEPPPNCQPACQANYTNCASECNNTCVTPGGYCPSKKADCAALQDAHPACTPPPSIGVEQPPKKK